MSICHILIDSLVDSATRLTWGQVNSIPAWQSRDQGGAIHYDTVRVAKLTSSGATLRGTYGFFFFRRKGGPVRAEQSKQLNSPDATVEQAGNVGDSVQDQLSWRICGYLNRFPNSVMLLPASGQTQSRDRVTLRQSEVVFFVNTYNRVIGAGVTGNVSHCACFPAVDGQPKSGTRVVAAAKDNATTPVGQKATYALRHLRSVRLLAKTK